MNESDDIRIPTVEMAGGTDQRDGTVPQAVQPTPPQVEAGSSKPDRKGVGGCFTHSPNCKCRPCSFRRRQKEALALATGDGRLPDEAQPAPLVPAKRKITAPKNLKERVAQYTYYAMMFPDLTKQAIAEKMGINPHQLGKIIRNGHEHGLLLLDDPLERIEYEIIPKVVANLNWFLDNKDRSVTIEAAKGTVFKAYQDSKGISDAPQTVLALKIEAAPLPTQSRTLTGTIVGKPRILEADIDET